MLLVFYQPEEVHEVVDLWKFYDGTACKDIKVYFVMLEVIFLDIFGEFGDRILCQHAGGDPVADICWQEGGGGQNPKILLT